VYYWVDWIGWYTRVKSGRETGAYIRSMDGWEDSGVENVSTHITSAKVSGTFVPEPYKAIGNFQDVKCRLLRNREPMYGAKGASCRFLPLDPSHRPRPGFLHVRGRNPVNPWRDRVPTGSQRLPARSVAILRPFELLKKEMSRNSSRV